MSENPQQKKYHNILHVSASHSHPTSILRSPLDSSVHHTTTHSANKFCNPFSSNSSPFLVARAHKNEITHPAYQPRPRLVRRWPVFPVCIYMRIMDIGTSICTYVHKTMKARFLRNASLGRCSHHGWINSVHRVWSSTDLGYTDSCLRACMRVLEWASSECHIAASHKRDDRHWLGEKKRVAFNEELIDNGFYLGFYLLLARFFFYANRASTSLPKSVRLPSAGAR